MKKLTAGLLLLGSVLAMGVSAQALTTDTVVLTVTPSGNKSVNIDLASFDFGSLAINTTDHLSTSATVTNDGNVVEDYRLRLSATDGVWVSSDTVGVDQYRLMALFDDPNTGGAPVTADFNTAADFITTTQVNADATNYAGDQTGAGVTATETRGLWFRLDMPTSSSVNTQRSFTVEVEAF